MKVQTTGVQDNGVSLLLMLSPSDEILAEQARIVSRIPRQHPIDQLHITLMPSPHSNEPLPSPPPFVDFRKPANLVTHENKTSAYLNVTQASQLELARFVTEIENALGALGIQNKERVFHVSLTNLVGLLGESVAHVWEHASTPV